MIYLANFAVLPLLPKQAERPYELQLIDEEQVVASIHAAMR